MQSGFQELLDEFMLEARERADEVESMLLRLQSADAEVKDAAIARVKRELHTLKGNSGMMGFSDLQALAHHMEDDIELLDVDNPEIGSLLTQLDELRQGLEAARAASLDLQETLEPSGSTEAQPLIEDQSPDPEADQGSSSETPGAAPKDTAFKDGVGGSVRVPFSKIDQLVEMQAETLIFRNRLSDSVQRGLALLKQTDAEDFISRSIAAWEDIEVAQQALEKTLNMIQEQVTNLGMVPLQSLFRSMRRVVHDESSKEGKSVELVIAGGETPIDKTLLEVAGNALGHLVRNAVIHGIEKPEERLRLGKSESGTVRVKATIEGSEIWIEVADDGAGVDLKGLKQRADELLGRGFETGSDLALLFTEGLSTHRGTDMSAGRGGWLVGGQEGCRASWRTRRRALAAQFGHQLLAPLAGHRLDPAISPLER